MIKPYIIRFEDISTGQKAHVTLSIELQFILSKPPFHFIMKQVVQFQWPDIIVVSLQIAPMVQLGSNRRGELISQSSLSLALVWAISAP